MRQTHRRTVYSALGLVLVATLAACGSESSNGQTVAVNLSLVVNSQQAHNESTASRIMAFLQRWIPATASAQAQSVTDITTIQVQVSGPDIPVQPPTIVKVTNPTSGQEIPVTIQAPVGANRTITVSAFNAAELKIFGGTKTGVTLIPGPPIDLTIPLVRLFTVIVQITGSGTVISTPAGIDCGATCSGQFEQGTSVTLNATAATNFAFVGWSGGGCTGTDPCTVNDNATVTATFNPAVTHHLTVNINGTGTVNSSPGGISCPPDCEENFSSGITVTLTAEPASTFTGWSGGGCSGTGQCIVVMNVDQTVNASFASPNTFTLTVSKGGVGLGTVTSSPPGIDCGTTCSSTSFAFPSGTSVTLTATPAAGSSFDGWSGSGCSGTGTCVVVMSQNRSVTATFNAVPSVLTVTKAGGGAGTVTSSPSGINCGSACSAASASFPTGSSVTLTAIASAGSVFAGWSGGGCSGTGTCTTVMTSDQTVIAQFDVAPTLTVTKSGTGNGNVTSSPAGINCGSTCSTSFAPGTVVTLTATPNGKDTFAGWSGAGCAGTDICIVVMNSDQAVNAEFNKM